MSWQRSLWKKVPRRVPVPITAPVATAMKCPLTVVAHEFWFLMRHHL
tara:strand:- start:11674 stop:11814 length:141 start_codon:yes stop_codon:yes gene_type:complete